MEQVHQYNGVCFDRGSNVRSSTNDYFVHLMCAYVDRSFGMSYKLQKFEQETIIRFDEESKEAYVDTHNKRWLNKLDKMAQETSIITVVKRTDGYGEYKLPKKLIQVKKPRYLSESDRLKLANRAKENFGH